MTLSRNGPDLHLDYLAAMAEVERLRGALERIRDGAIIESHGAEWVACIWCERGGRTMAELPHVADCPVRIAKEALEERA